MSCCNTTDNKGNVPTRQTVRTFEPNVDIYETGDDWMVVADVPGASREGLDLSFEEGVLSVKARVTPRQVGQTSFLLREYPIGDFERSFRVGEGIDASRINATLDAGVLTIRLPKAESSKPRKIEVRNN